MKKFLSVLLLCTSLTRLSSQSTYNAASHTSIDRSGNMVSIHSKNYYLKSSEGCCDSKTFVTGIDANSNELFSKDIGTGYVGFIKLVNTADNCLLALGVNSSACDIGDAKNFVTKLDTNGQVLFEHVILSGSYNYGETIDIVASQDSSFFISADSLIIKYDKNGSYEAQFVPGLTDIHAISMLGNGNLLINGKVNAAFTNMIYDPINLAVISQQTTNYVIKKFSEAANGTIIALTTGGVLISYNSGLNYIGTTANLSTAMNVRDFSLKSDTIYAAGVSGNNNCAFYVMLNSSLANLYLSQSNYELVSPTGVTINNKNKIHIISTGSSSPFSQITFNGLFRMDQNGSFSTGPDIGIVSFSTTSAILQNYNNGYYNAVVDLSVVVKNYGTDTVKSFYLNHYGGSLQLCAALYHKLFSTVIPPGGTVTVQTGNFAARPILFFASPVNATISLPLCPFTTVPDFKNDVQVNNDSRCDSVQFILTGLEKNYLADKKNVTVAPNPFTNQLNIKSEFTIYRLEVSNSFGEIVKTLTVNDKDVVIEEATFPSGVYLLKIETENGILIKKIIKE